MQRKPLAASMFTILVSSVLLQTSVDAQIYAPNSVVQGKTIGEWTGEWWNWAYSFPIGSNPFTDPTGALQNQNQTADVFFIAGNSGGSSNRSFTVPDDKPLLMPLINVGYYRTPEEGEDGDPETPRDPAAIQADTEGFADLIGSLNFSLDGTATPEATLFEHREATFFTGEVLADSVGSESEPVGMWPESYTSGYWVMLEPLSLGTHEIQFGGLVPDFDFGVDATANITVVPEPSTGVLAMMVALTFAGIASRRRRRATYL